MAAGTAQNASQEQPTAYPPPQPPHHSDRSPLPSAWGCAGCALVILVAIWLLRLFLGEHSSETLAAFAPSDALLYAEAGSPAACSQWLGRLGLISAKGDKTPLTIEDSIASWVASNLADVSSREARRVLEKIERAAIVWARGDGDRATWLLLLRLRGKIELPALVAAAPSTAGQARIALKDGTPIYTAQLETVAAFSPDAGLVRFSQESGQQPERTLANLAAQAVRPEKNLPWALISGQAAADFCRQFSESGRPLLDLAQRLPAAGAYLLIAAGEGSEKEPLIAVRALHAPAAEESMSLFGWLLGVVGWLVAIPLAIIALLAAIALLMACYHYALSWWQGRLSPRLPPHKPDLPPALAEDVAAAAPLTAKDKSEDQNRESVQDVQG